MAAKRRAKAPLRRSEVAKRPRTEEEQKSSGISGPTTRSMVAKDLADAPVTLRRSARIYQQCTEDEEKLARTTGPAKKPLLPEHAAESNAVVARPPARNKPQRTEDKKTSTIITIRDCDASLYGKFWRAFRILTPFSLRGSKNWGNLMQWCRSVWQGKALKGQRLDTDEKHAAVILGAVRIAKQHARRNWEECEQALETYRVVVGKFEPKWLR